MADARIAGPVRIVGAGLLGASIGLVLRRHDIDVTLVDTSPTAVALATQYGAGRPATDADTPALIVVAVPPDVVADVVARELSAFPNAIVTDVASVKGSIEADLRAREIDLSRYVGSHPMAGRERGGAVSARADIFTGRSWVVCTRSDATNAAINMVSDLVIDCGANLVEMSTDDHDAAVALVSHVPQIVASAVASSLIGASDSAVGLAGGGLRDVTRIAASEPNLWLQILSANSTDVTAVLEGVHERLGAVLDALRGDEPAMTLAELMTAGNAGVARIPGKHGRNADFAHILVVIDDRPGQLAQLLADIGDLGINMEDLRLEHSPGSAIGFAEVSVLAAAEATLVSELEVRGWRIAGDGQ